MSYHKTSLLSVLCFCFLCSVAQARIGGGISFVISSPQEEFANVSEMGYGVSGKIFANPPTMNFFAIRADFTYINYGSETAKDIYVPGTINLYVDITTRYNSYQFTVGPQVSADAGPFFFYFAPMAGIYNYSTTESVEETSISQRSWSITKFGWSVSGGTTVKLYTLEQPGTPGIVFGADFEMKYHTVKNIIPSEIRGEKDANDLTFHVGVVVMTK